MYDPIGCGNGGNNVYRIVQYNFPVFISYSDVPTIYLVQCHSITHIISFQAAYVNMIL